MCLLWAGILLLIRFEFGRSGPVRSGPDFAKPSAKIKRFPFHFACANACVM